MRFQSMIPLETASTPVKITMLLTWKPLFDISRYDIITYERSSVPPTRLARFEIEGKLRRQCSKAASLFLFVPTCRN